MAAHRFRQLVEEMRERYSVVFLVGPPVTRPDQSPSIVIRPSSSSPNSTKNEMAASSDSTTMPTLSIR